MKTLHLIGFLLVASLSFGQNAPKTLTGKVSFVTSNNVYVKFERTQDIQVGDTLNFSSDGVLTPCLVVTAKSSTSCVSVAISNCEVKKEDQIIYSIKPSNQKPATVANRSSEPEPIKLIKKDRFNNVSGKFAASVNSNISETRDNSYRTMYRFSLTANKINGSKFSFETYINYSQNFNEDKETGLQKRDYLNVYNLGVRYDHDSTLTMFLGRKVNRKASTLGVIDGFQVEKIFGKYYAGAIVGFRPDVYNYSFNSSLFQYGGYVGLNGKNKFMRSQTTMGYLEQTNAGKIDRRFSYFQHSSSIGKKTSIYSSLELDLYNNANISATSSPRLTNIYISANYKLHKKVRLNVSYGARKRILYYETYPDQISQVLANDEARHGLTFKVHTSPTKNTSAGISYSSRFQNNSQNKSNNINGYFSFYRIPKIGGKITANYNRNMSNYFSSNIISIRHSRSLIKNKLNADFYYRYVKYDYLNHELTRNQSYIGSSFNYRLRKKLLCSLLGEVSMQNQENIYRVNFKVIQRF
jgi:hypothetical protein